MFYFSFLVIIDENVRFVYGCSFVAKLSLNNFFFEKIFVFFTKYISFAEKNIFIWKKSFIFKIFFTEKNFFYREKYK